MTKEHAKKLQNIRLAMVELKNSASGLDCNIDAEMEDALQKIMAKEDEYWNTAKPAKLDFIAPIS